MNREKTIYHLRKAYKFCPKDYTCRPQIKAWLTFIESAHLLNLPIYIEQSGVMYRFFRDIAENEQSGLFYDECMFISFAP